MLPYRGDIINVVPYGPAKVLRMLSEARAEVQLVDGFVRGPEGKFTRTICVEVHQVWTPSPAGDVVLT